jgi:hypothetical protein
MSERKTIKRFRDLRVLGDRQTLCALIEPITLALPPNWQEDAESGKELPGFAGERYFVFTRDGDNHVPSCRLILHLNNRSLWVSNIQLQKSRDISFNQYNAALGEFEVVLRKQVSEYGNLRIQTTDENAHITEWVTPEAAKKLEAFSCAANKSTGSGHSYDSQRWIKFVVQTHLDGSSLEIDDLRRWLIEALGWKGWEDQVDGLILQYEFGRALLNAYDKR